MSSGGVTSHDNMCMRMSYIRSHINVTRERVNANTRDIWRFQGKAVNVNWKLQTQFIDNSMKITMWKKDENYGFLNLSLCLYIETCRHLPRLDLPPLYSLSMDCSSDTLESGGRSRRVSASVTIMEMVYVKVKFYFDVGFVDQTYVILYSYPIVRFQSLCIHIQHHGQVP